MSGHRLDKLTDKELISKATKSCDPHQQEYPARREYLIEVLRRFKQVADGPAAQPMPTPAPLKTEKKLPANQRAAKARAKRKAPAKKAAEQKPAEG